MLELQGILVGGRSVIKERAKDSSPPVRRPEFESWHGWWPVVRTWAGHFSQISNLILRSNNICPSRFKDCSEPQKQLYTWTHVEKYKILYRYEKHNFLLWSLSWTSEWHWGQRVYKRSWAPGSLDKTFFEREEIENFVVIPFKFNKHLWRSICIYIQHYDGPYKEQTI